VKKIIFLLQEHNSIDQITPLVEILHERGHELELVKTIHYYDYNRDNNIKYLVEKFPKIIIKDLFSNKNKLYNFLHDKYNYFNRKSSLEKNFIGEKIYHILRGITRRIIFKMIKVKQKDTELLFKDLNSNNCILVSELTNGDHNYRPFLIKAKEKDIYNISFTHGFDVLTNYLLSYPKLKLFDPTLNNDATNYSDKMVVFNTLAKKRNGEKHFSKHVVMPSLRFTSYWIEKIKNRDNHKIDYFKQKSNLKIVFMLSATGYNIWLDEQFRTIESLLMIDGIQLIIKVHPRNISIANKFSKIKKENLMVVSNDIPSSVLIDWSDIVMCIGSGIIIEAIIKKKIIFYMKYLHCNKIELEETKKLIHKIETRDEFLSLLEKYKRSKLNDFIDEDERSLFLKDYIGNNDFEENKMKYINLFEKL
jgi:hypothetical protein